MRVGGLKMKIVIKCFLILFSFCVIISCVTAGDSAVQPLADDAVQKVKAPVIESVDIDEYGGADSYGAMGDHADSPYFKNPDYFNMKGASNVTIIPEFKTYQQTSEWSCGCCAALMVLHHFGITEYTEWDIAVKMTTSVDEDTPGAEPGSANNFYEFGTSVKEMYDFFSSVPGIRVTETSYRADWDKADIIAADEEGVSPSDRGNLYGYISANALYTTDNDDNSENWVDDAADSWFVKWIVGNLDNGRPIMVEWSDWDGHWQTIIGYDSMGTPGIGDDILILADSYDTSDHWQDGYYAYPLERWFYMWHDRHIAPKPFQLQPYIIVDLE